MSAIQPNYDALDEVLSAAGALGEASELHGQLCGLICVSGPEAAPDWIGDALDGATATDFAQESAARLMADLALATWRVLDGGDLDFQPLLPADHHPLDWRAEHLGGWCQGFAHGLATTPVGQQALAQGVTAEIVEDFAQISRAGVGDEETQEEGEAAYAELVEFVRVSVQLVFEELHGLRSAPQDQARTAGP